jgi:GntR family transcriptional repressor for pyruvate dehydrogenase complex
LASQLKVGRPAVREALKALSILDVVESRRGKGSYIKCLAALHAGWPENVRHIGADLDMLELLEVRKMLEPRAAALAAMRATEQQIGEMERELIAQQTHINNRKLATNKHDYLFHDAIIRAAGNGILQELNRFLTPLLLKSRQITSQIPPDLTHMIREHQAIIEAIRVGEPELAARAMHDHLQNVGLELISGRVRMKIGAVQTN